MNVIIESLGHYLPERRLTNADLEQMVETSDDWITARTGIKERRIAGKDENTSDMAIAAATEALEGSAIDPQDLELIVVATTSPDSNFPSVACLVQKALGAKKAAAFDVSAACSGFLIALTTAKQYLATGLYKNALVIASDKITNFIDWNDRGTCVLFGDGAGACILSITQEARGIQSDFILSQGEFADVMSIVAEPREPLDQTSTSGRLPFIQMRGQELFKVAVNSMADAVKVALEKANLKAEDVACVVPHQANDRIISAVARKLGLSKDKVFINIQKYGNMSAASIAVALYEAVKEGHIHKGDVVVLVSFGAGLVGAANVIVW